MSMATPMNATMNSQGAPPNMTIGKSDGAASATAMAMGVDQMPVVFFNSYTTPLFSKAWTPSDPAAYAATCIFILLLGVVHRLLIAFRNILFKEPLAVDVAARGEKAGLPPPTGEDDETSACLGHGSDAGEGPQARLAPSSSRRRRQRRTCTNFAPASCELAISLASYLL